jgi:hypothetical protein
MPGYYIYGKSDVNNYSTLHEIDRIFGIYLRIDAKTNQLKDCILHLNLTLIVVILKIL